MCFGNSLNVYIIKTSEKVTICSKKFRQELPNFFISNETNDYMFKVSNRNTRTKCEICSE